MFTSLFLICVFRRTGSGVSDPYWLGPKSKFRQSEFREWHWWDIYVEWVERWRVQLTELWLVIYEQLILIVTLIFIFTHILLRNFWCDRSVTKVQLPEALTVQWILILFDLPSLILISTLNFSLFWLSRGWTFFISS